MILSSPLSTARPLPTGYDHTSPSTRDLRCAVTALAGEQSWAALTWSELIDALVAVGRTDIPLARLVEGHVDAIRILGQAGVDPVPSRTYGVWASRSQRTGVSVVEGPNGSTLEGTVKFASGSGVIDRALVPVWLDERRHLLVDLDVTGLPVDPGQWRTAAMEQSHSHTVTVSGIHLDQIRVVGETDFYLGRPAFFPGGVGVAACWVGGASRVADLTWRRLRPPIAEPLLPRLGRIRTALVAAVATVRATAARLDELLPAGGAPSDTDWHALATEARAVAAESAHVVIGHAERIAGPAGLAYDAELTRAVHDLRLYLLQANGDADAALLGRSTDQARDRASDRASERPQGGAGS